MTTITKPKDASDKPLVIEDSKPKETDFQMNTHLTKMEKRYAEQEAVFIRPCGWISPAGPANPRFEKQRKDAWEYVVGVVEAKEGISSMPFHEQVWCEWGGDPITKWKIPTQKVVAIPKGLAKEIQKNCKYTAYVINERETTKGDKHGDFLTSWRAEEIRNTATFSKVNDL